MTATLTPEWALLLEDEDMRVLVAQYASEMPDRIKLLQQALAARDYAWLRRLAHQIKGSAGLYGFPKLSAKAAELEALVHSQQSDTVLASVTADLIELCKQPQASLEQYIKGRP